MKSLFPLDSLPSISGLTYLPSYVTTSDELALAAAIDRRPWDTTWDRRRQPYGRTYGRGPAPEPVPAWAQAIADRMLAEGIVPLAFDQVLVNEYLPGQGIALHLDYEPFDRVVASLSLLSDCVMDFRHPVTGHQEHLLLLPRSLLVMSDEARYDWQHGIAPRKRDAWQGQPVDRRRRLSVTFRFVADGAYEAR